MKLYIINKKKTGKNKKPKYMESKQNATSKQPMGQLSNQKLNLKILETKTETQLSKIYGI